MGFPEKYLVKKTIILMLIIFLPGCAKPRQEMPPESTVTSQVLSPTLSGSASGWSVYHPDPTHLWNRVFRQLYRRTSLRGEEYGAEELDPLLWFDTTYLLTGPSHRQAVQVLEEFLSTHAENLIREPLARAMFQRDLWAVFDWLTWQAEPYPIARQELGSRLAQIMRRVALSKEEILSLPDNYALAVESKDYPAEVDAGSPEIPFLPTDLFQPGSAWVPLGREGGPVAMTHTEAFPFFGRSAFLVFVRSPAGRDATLDFIESLNAEPTPVTVIGSDVALVRRMLLIDEQGEIILSPLVETIQIRHFSPAQSFHEFELDRSRLLQGLAGGLALHQDFFMLFMSHGDVFESPDIPDERAAIPQICKACHFEDPPIPDSGNTRSIISYSRQPFALPENESPVLFATTVIQEARTVIQWKSAHGTWITLQSLWEQANR
jgi:hypothetical protein